MESASTSRLPTAEDIATAGKQSSIVQHFGITGLYGYRSISLESPYAATILIAKNGSGKSTLLGALDAFLKCQFHRLQSLQFKEIVCRLRGIDEPLVISQSDIKALLDVPKEGDLARYSRLAEVDVGTLRKFISEDYEKFKNDYTALSEDKVFSAILRSTSYNYMEATNICNKLSANLYTEIPYLNYISQQIKSILSEIDVIYLPTFRRVELPLHSEEGTIKGSRRARIKFAGSSSLYGGDIQFGLGDIHERLSDLNRRILNDSNIGYRRISANIINELIDGTFEREDFVSDRLPDKESLDLFFSRLKEGGKRIGPYSEVAIPNIERIYGPEHIGVESRKALRYFLSKLYDVINSTKDIELRVEEFISICNRYLSGFDESTIAPSGNNLEKKYARIDGKILRLVRRNLKVYAESISSGKRIPLDSLSSGEKQMISLFAKLYLYEREKLLLIDEPELSMSINWQRQILADVVTSPLCRQVIAITHSPFVFDNPLEPFARSLKLTLDKDGPGEDFFDEEDQDE